MTDRADSTVTDHDAGERTPRYRVRTHARERALKILFQADVRGVDAVARMAVVGGSRAELDLLDDLDLADADTLEESVARARAAAPARGLHDLTVELVEGVAAHLTTIDGILDRFANHWSVPRMPRVDRNILRLGVFELLGSDTPNPVVIDEMLMLSSAFAGERTGPFVNGVLESVRRASERGGLRLDDLAPADPGGTDAPDPAATADDPAGSDAPARAPDDRDEVDDEAVALLDAAEDVGDPRPAVDDDADLLALDDHDGDLDLLLDEFDDLDPETELAILLGEVDED